MRLGWRLILQTKRESATAELRQKFQDIIPVQLTTAQSPTGKSSF